MSANFSQIKDLLTQKTDTAQHRHIFIFAGDENWQKERLQEILSGHEENTLWIGEDGVETLPSISVKKAHSWLGREKQVVVFDANTQFDADAFAAITGIVIGGGLFILLMPDEEQWADVYSSCFGKRLIQSINSTPEINLVRQNDINIKLFQSEVIAISSLHCDEPYLTLEQQHVVEVIENEVQKKSFLAVVLVSDRGRGKSAALGIAAANLVKAGIKNIAITAPRLRSTEIIFKHIESLLPEADISRGKVKYKNSVIQFYSPDQLIEENIKTEILFIDEAAAIPVPLLTSFLNKYPQCIFATTVHGYEGTGRGFALRFNKILNQQKPGWKKRQMKAPVRWAENDPLEKWMFSLLCLDAEIISSNIIGKVDLNKLELTSYNNIELAKDSILLNDVFSLLVLAHYRTQPSDLLRLLDDENITLYVAKYNLHVLSIALVGHEGAFSALLSTQVYRGERRPPGHLLAQALTYHCGVEFAATLNYARVMRIAVHPEYQHQSIGTKLLDFVTLSEKKSGCDAIGTSFGMNKPLLDFWQQSDFNVVRIGFKREQTSGEHAAIMMKSLSQAGNKVYQQAYDQFIEKIPFWFDDVLNDLPDEIKNIFQYNVSQLNGSQLNGSQLNGSQLKMSLSELDKKDLQSFVMYSRNYELCIAALNKLVMLEKEVLSHKDFQKNFQIILNEKIINKLDWKKISEKMALSGKGYSRKLFYHAIVELIGRSRNNYFP